MKTSYFNLNAFSIALAITAALMQGCATKEKKVTAAAGGAEGPGDSAQAYLEVLRSDFNTSKIRTLNQVMKLRPAEAEKFWPIYRNYEQELAAVGDRKLVLIREFVRHEREGSLNDGNSKDIAERWLQNVQDRLDLWKKYQQRISDKVSPIRAGQFLQVENQMALFVDINIASEMPVAGR